jgi:hypothetical protein
MFAGPNGSGKSTIKSVISPELLGVYINPDDIEKSIRECGMLDFRTYGIATSAEEISSFLKRSTLLAKANLLDEAQYLEFGDGVLSFAEVSVNSYYASVVADFMRHKLLESGTSFTF